jgi:hypothetical protein
MPAITKPNQYFDATLYTGTGSSLSVTNGGFQPDLVWAKNRGAANYNVLTDSVRGVLKTIYSNTNDAEVSGNGLTAFNSNGFSVDGTNANWNNSSYNFASWQWKAGGTPVTNTSGTISSQVSANPTAGFSIATYSGNSSSGQTVGHGLGVSPDMIIVKARNATNYWIVQHKSLTSITRNVYLNDTSSEQNDAQFTAKSSTTVSIHNSGGSTNQSGTNYVMYCWAAVAGYSAFGSYTGNGSTDGPFIYTGFRPRFVMIKASNTGGAGYDWFIHDTSRDTYNQCTLDLEANLSATENGYGAEQDFLSER